MCIGLVRLGQFLKLTRFMCVNNERSTEIQLQWSAYVQIQIYRCCLRYLCPGYGLLLLRELCEKNIRLNIRQKNYSNMELSQKTHASKCRNYWFLCAPQEFKKNPRHFNTKYKICRIAWFGASKKRTCNNSLNNRNWGFSRINSVHRKEN